MKRTKPLRADPERVREWQERSRTELARTTALDRNTPLAAINRQRRAKLDREQYGEKAVWVRAQPCYVTGREEDIVAAHVVSRGAGGKSEHLVPFHALVEADWHGLDEAKFEEKYGVAKQMCKDAAEAFEQTWQRLQRGEDHRPF
jgi:hypothetical protein